MGDAVRARGSSPKLQIFNTALLTAPSGLTPTKARADPEFWGRLTEGLFVNIHTCLAPSSPDQRHGRRFNGRISKVLATTGFDSAQSLEDTLSRYVRLYNHHIPQRALGHLAPVQALQDWQERCPDLFKKKVYNHTGLDRCLVLNG